MQQHGVQRRNTPETHCFGHVAPAETNCETNMLRVAAISKHFDIAARPKPPKHVRNKIVSVPKHTPKHRSTPKHGATGILEGYPLKSQKYPSKCCNREYRAETHPKHTVSAMLRRPKHPFSQNRPKFRHFSP